MRAAAPLRVILRDATRWKDRQGGKEGRRELGEERGGGMALGSIYARADFVPMKYMPSKTQHINLKT